MKTFTIGQLVTAAELEKAMEIIKTTPDHQRAQTLHDQLILPNIQRINKALGQSNDPMYLSYALYYTLTKGGPPE